MEEKMSKVLVCLLAVVSLNAIAQDVYITSRFDAATVVSVQPRFATRYQRECTTERVQTNNANLGTVIGGVTGGIIGNQVGNGSGRDVATVLGAVIGAGVGNRIGEDQRNYEYRETCRNVPISRQIGETVTFEYKGRRFTQTFDY